jgi:hypothetical protein
MINLWLKAIEDLILAAPGGTDEAGETWVSTLDRLGVADVEAGRERVYWDRDEAEDVGLDRPCFVLQEVVLDWSEYNLNDLALLGVVEVYFTEAALEGAATHKLSKEYFSAWTGSFIANCAERSKVITELGVPINRIRQSLLASRTPRVDRDPDHPERDYWEAAWEFWIGERSRWAMM